jgi:hypothetical protein
MTPLDSLDDRSAEAVCAECGQTVPREDTQAVAGKTVCNRCVEAIRARVSAQIDTSGGASAAPAAPAYNFSTPTALGTGYAESGAASSAPAQQPASLRSPVGEAGGAGAGRLLLGALFGLIVGVIGAFIYDKFVFYTHIQFGLVASFIGFAIGFAVLLGTGRGGILPAIIGGTLAFGAMVLSHYLLFNDLFGQEVAKNPEMAAKAAASGITGLPFSPEGFAFVFKHLDFMDWVFILIGVYGGFSTPFRATSGTTTE